MRPGGKSNGESPFFEKPFLSFEERVGNVAADSNVEAAQAAQGRNRGAAGLRTGRRTSRWSTAGS